MVVYKTPRELPLLASLRRTPKQPPGTGAVDQGAANGAEATAFSAKATARKGAKAKKKVKKGAPAEVSSRRPVAPRGPAAERKGAAKARDPRFDDLSGKLDVDLFQKSYSFLEDYRQQELSQMKDMARSFAEDGEDVDEDEDGEVARAQLQQQIRRRIQEDKQRSHLGSVQDTQRSLKRQEREKVRQTGKTPYFHSNSHVKRLVREKKWEGKKGSRNVAAERREKKVAAKEKKRLPRRRGEVEG